MLSFVLSMSRQNDYKYHDHLFDLNMISRLLPFADMSQRGGLNKTPLSMKMAIARLGMYY
jgi:hypothetical protein